jgi:hypothetical protein
MNARQAKYLGKLIEEYGDARASEAWHAWNDDLKGDNHKGTPDAVLKTLEVKKRLNNYLKKLSKPTPEPHTGPLGS